MVNLTFGAGCNTEVLAPRTANVCNLVKGVQLKMKPSCESLLYHGSFLTWVLYDLPQNTHSLVRITRALYYGKSDYISIYATSLKASYSDYDKQNTLFKKIYLS